MTSVISTCEPKMTYVLGPFIVSEIHVLDIVLYFLSSF
jgi:hypothetical protein